MITFNRAESLTQAYHAGIIIARIENYLPKESIPPVGVCLVKFYALRELLGERLWQKLKARKSFTDRIRVYEALTYQPFLPVEMIGTSREFCLGYAHSYEFSRLKRENDKRVNKVRDTILRQCKLTRYD